MKQVNDCEVIVHGVEHEQYFQGCGVSFTSYTDVATGIGSTAREALEDALDSLAQNDWDVEGFEAELPSGAENIELPDDAHEELWVYVSVRVK